MKYILCSVSGEAPPGGAASITRALFPSQAGIVPPPSATETFTWLLRPPEGTVAGTFYSDGSRLDGGDPLTARLGWSFDVRDDGGRTVAAARGVPPPPRGLTTSRGRRHGQYCRRLWSRSMALCSGSIVSHAWTPYTGE